MKIARVLAAFAAMVAASWLAAPAGAGTLSLVGSSSKVCQATGQADWDTGLPTNALTHSKYGLDGIDLGFPVESDTGALYFLFGDSIPPKHPPNTWPWIPPDDALGKTTRTTAPDAKTCIDLTFFGGPLKGTLGHPTVTPAIEQGAFNVPTGGVYVNGKFWAWFWTDHCMFPIPQLPTNPVNPLTTPDQSVGCPEGPLGNSIGRSVMASSVDPHPLAFTQIPASAVMPNGFVYTTAGPPIPRRRGVDYVRGYQAPIPVFGVPRYRASIPYVALAPQKSFGDPTTWKYFGGTSASGPIWLTFAQWQSGSSGGAWSPPAGAEVYTDTPNPGSPTGDERCVGEHQVTYNWALQGWLMLYTCGGLLVEARTAPEPWGPWSPPTVILNGFTTPSLFCHLLWVEQPQPGVDGNCPGKIPMEPQGLRFGYLYAPFAMTRFTEDKTAPGPGNPKVAKIYWLLSTWEPYEVVVMQSTLKLTP